MILGRRHGAASEEMISGPEIPYGEQRKLFREFKLVREHPEFESVTLCALSEEGHSRLAKPIEKAKPKRKNEED